MKESYYFAYGSNMNLDQMAYRCPAASVVEKVKLEGYRLTFCGRGKGCGVATILPEEGSRVEGVLWKITPECEKSLDFYEGYPHLYGKETVLVQGKDGVKREVMAYTMNRPYRDSPALPSRTYLEGILNGCRQNGIPTRPILETVQRIQNQLPHEEKAYDKGFRRKNRREPEWR